MGILETERKFAWSLSGFVIGIISLIATSLFYYYSEFRNKIDFKVIIEDEFNIVELKEHFPDIKIIYNDKDIFKEGKQIKVIVFSFQNEGEPILQNYYDVLNPFQLSFENSQILKTEIISSNSDYLNKNFIKTDSSKFLKRSIEFNKVIFESGKKIEQDFVI